MYTYTHAKVKKFKKQAKKHKATLQRTSANVHAQQCYDEAMLVLCVKHTLQICKDELITRSSCTSEDAVFNAVQRNNTALYNYMETASAQFYSLYVALVLALLKK